MTSPWVPTADPAARDPSTNFPLDGLHFNIGTMPQDTLLAYGEAAPALHSLGGTRITRLSKTLVMKSGTRVLTSEYETMKYVKATFPEVRLPRVYRFFTTEAVRSNVVCKMGCIIMDYVDGRCLDSCWDQLSPEAQEDIATQVAAVVNQLQTKRCDHPGVIGGGLSRGYWFSDYEAGPFTTKEGFSEWINWKLALGQYFKQAPMDVPPIKFPYFVLIHGDLSPRNLVLDAHDQVWLLDWDCAGVYPPIFEAASVKHQLHFPNFAELLLPLIYNDPAELRQLESCYYGIHRMPLSLPPGMESPYE
ncbi:phosphotransferase family protein [Lentithecium fluviatile CBS 122367]|uniref:Phosphotransferase family protein n=1 Tax=Lentithecium fluviatile CBS 122367 TaxID=1168545 RepID=A0A6G1IN76_9PLEO|nr:phosphotransferase family protein [Lentithecium fluviatile CBS 122367]